MPFPPMQKSWSGVKVILKSSGGSGRSGCIRQASRMPRSPKLYPDMQVGSKL